MLNCKVVPPSYILVNPWLPRDIYQTPKLEWFAPTLPTKSNSQYHHFGMHPQKDAKRHHTKGVGKWPFLFCFGSVSHHLQPYLLEMRSPRELGDVFFPDIYQPLLLMLDLIDSQQWVGLSDYYHSWLFHDLYPCKRWNRYILPTDIPVATVQFAFKSPDRRRDRSPRWGPCATCPCRCPCRLWRLAWRWSFPKLGVPPQQKWGCFIHGKSWKIPFTWMIGRGTPHLKLQMEGSPNHPEFLPFFETSSYWGSPILGHPHMGKWWFSSGFWQSLSGLYHRDSEGWPPNMRIFPSII